MDTRCKDCADDRDFDSNDSGGMVEKFDVDPTGDYFGDYSDYDMDIDSDTENPGEELTTSDEEDDDFDNGFNLTMNIFEPERQPHFSETPLASENQVDDLDTPGPGDSSARGLATRLRGGAEMELRKEPFIVKFTTGQAGAVHTRQVVDDNLNASYTRKVGSAESPFYPFLSKMEWEIARWAKMRGPSSTAFTEFMNIEGVSFFILL